MKIPKFLSPSKKEKSSVPNVIYIAVEEVSEELLIFIAAINNKTLQHPSKIGNPLKKE